MLRYGMLLYVEWWHSDARRKVLMQYLEESHFPAPLEKDAMSEILVDFADGLYVFCHQIWVLSNSMHWRRYLVADSLEESYFDIDSFGERKGSGVSRDHASEVLEDLAATDCLSSRCVVNRPAIPHLNCHVVGRVEKDSQSSAVARSSAISKRSRSPPPRNPQQLKPKLSTSHLCHPKNLIEGKRISLLQHTQITSQTQ